MLTDVRSALSESLGEGLEASSGKDIRFNCPRCRHTDYRLYVSPEKVIRGVRGWYHCFECGWAGPLSNLLSAIFFDLAFAEPGLTVEELWRRLYAIGLQAAEEEGHPHPLQYPVGAVCLAPGQPAWEYLLRRGVTSDEIRDYGLFLAAEDGFSRIYFPETDADGQLVFWVARLYNAGRGPKYRNVPGGKRRFFLYNLARAIMFDEVVLCEGPISAILAGPNAVAAYGKEVTKEQIDLLAACRKPVVVALDGDARAFSFRVLSELRSRGVPCRYVSMPVGEDPASLGREEFSRRVQISSYVTDVGLLQLRLLAM